MLTRSVFDDGVEQLYHRRAMGQRVGTPWWTISVRFFLPWRMIPLCAVACCLAGGCGRSGTTNPSTGAPASTAPSGVTVASLSPAATDILIGLGAGDRLVAVSNFDPPRSETKNLPRVGDYQTTDWERLAAVHPGVMITQFGPGRTPAGLQAKADSLHIRLVNVSITRLDDIYHAMTTLADAIGEHEVGVRKVHALRGRLDAIAKQSQGHRTRALIVLDSQAHSVAGRDNYLNDALSLAGGDNVIAPGGAPYPQIDREMLLALDPPVIFQLMPDASPQVLEATKRMWRGLSDLQAVREGQVHIVTEPWALSPSQHVADLAEVFSRGLRAVKD